MWRKERKRERRWREMIVRLFASSNNTATLWLLFIHSCYFTCTWCNRVTSPLSLSLSPSSPTLSAHSMRPLPRLSCSSLFLLLQSNFTQSALSSIFDDWIHPQSGCVRSLYFTLLFSPFSPLSLSLSYFLLFVHSTGKMWSTCLIQSTQHMQGVREKERKKRSSLSLSFSSVHCVIWIGLAFAKASLGD